MKNKRKNFFAVAGILLMLVLAGEAYAINYLDGKVEFHGRWANTLIMPTHKNVTPNQLHSTDIVNLRSSLKLELMWHAYDGPDYQINVYSIFKNYYDFARDVDAGYRKYVQDFSGHRGFREIQFYDKFDHICRELYAEFNNPTYQVRLGKQVEIGRASCRERV